MYWFSKDTTFVSVKSSKAYSVDIIIIINKVVFIKIIIKMKF
jgi:hypothetical protein